jgi:N-acetylmuramoyl-L-alanine amidase
MLKKYIRYTIFSFLFVLPNIWARPVVLVDPGHGGNEYGAQSTSVKAKQILEKDLALQIAQKITNKLKGKVDAYLTRSLDRTISLQERAKLVEKLGAELFISVHINSSEDVHSNGFETYYLDNKNDSAVKKVVDNENAKSDLPEEIQLILTDLVVAHTVDSSKQLAGHIHGYLAKVIPPKFGVKDRGVRRGLFYVLALSKIPGVLLECGFISNANDLKKMTDPKFQNEYAESVSRGILDYFKEVKKTKK